VIFFSVYHRGRSTILGRRTEDGSDECFVQLGKGLLGRTPRCRGHRAEFFKEGEELCEAVLDLRVKGEC